MDYLEKHNNSGIRIGDTVLILPPPPVHEMEASGWQNTWEAAMLDAVGQLGEVEGDVGDHGFFVSLPEIPINYAYPYYSLQHVESFDLTLSKTLPEVVDYMKQLVGEPNQHLRIEEDEKEVTFSGWTSAENVAAMLTIFSNSIAEEDAPHFNEN